MNAESTDRKDTILNDYMEERDDILKVWGWNVQQISNNLLYHALGINELTSNERVDYLGSEIRNFIIHASYAFRDSRVLFPEESCHHLDMFINIMERIDNKEIPRCIEVLQNLKQWFMFTGYFQASTLPLIT